MNLKYNVIPTPNLSNTLKCDELKQLFFYFKKLKSFTIVKKIITSDIQH